MLTVKEDLDRLAALIVIVWGLLLPFCAFSDSTHPVFLFILSVDIFLVFHLCLINFPLIVFEVRVLPS